MSFREKTAWIAILSISVVYGSYFWSAFRSGPHARADLFTLTVAVVGLVIVQIVLTIAAAMFSPKDARAPRDERDRLIALRATRVAYSGLATSVVFAAFFAAFNPPIVFNSNALLFVLVASEILRYACQIMQYRRQA